jgi:uncharacterized protein
MTQRTVLSPCIGVCDIEIDTGYCRGCWRTLGEIAAWPEYDDVQRRGVLAAARQREASAAPRS